MISSSSQPSAMGKSASGLTCGLVGTGSCSEASRTAAMASDQEMRIRVFFEKEATVGTGTRRVHGLIRTLAMVKVENSRKRVSRAQRESMAGIVDTFANIVTPKPNALMPVANGSEEIEVAALTDILARGGVRVIIADVDGDEDHVVTLAKGLELQADKTILHCGDDTYDLIVVPGGPGAKTLGDCALLVDMIRKQKAAGRWFGGICAGPVDVLFRHALVTGPMTCFPGFKDQVGDLYRDQPVVVSDNCVTSQGPGTAVAMGLKLVELLRSPGVARNLANDLIYRL